MGRACAFMGMIIGSSIGGWLGGKFGLFTMVILSSIGAGVGLYYGRRFSQDFLD